MGEFIKQHQILKQKITIDQVNRFTGQAILGITATALNSTILAVTLWGLVPTHRVLIWLSGILSISLVRILIHVYYQRRPITPDRVDLQKTVLLISLAVSGCIWGAAPVFLFPYSSIAHQVFMAFVLGGMVAGSVNVFASVMAGFYAYSIPTIVPLIFVFFTVGTYMHYGMGIMLLLFSIFMCLANRGINREINDFLTVKYENIDLIDNLEREIKERQIAEKELLLKNQQIESIVEARTAELRQVNEKLRNEIEDRIEAEKALRESEFKYRELANSLPQIVFETDAQGLITFANRNTYELLGYSENEFQNGLSAFQILTAEQGSLAHDRLQDVLGGQRLDGEEYVVHTKEGSTFPVSIHATPVEHNEKCIGMRGIIIDLTDQKRTQEEQKKLQAQLQRAQKMEILGIMAGGVAHDLNNILSGIVSYPDLLLMQIPADSALRKPILVMQESGKKAAAVVQDLLTLTRRGVVVEEVLNINDIISAYLESPEHEKLMSFHPSVWVDTSLKNNLLNISGSRVHLIKTIMNLVSNAAEAMPDGGMIQISTVNRYLDQPVKGYDDIEEGDYVVLSVTDNGIGIAPNEIDQIFEPFFTKKVMGRSGTGLGMAVVWGTVKDHKGYIDVASIENEGSQFSLYFPVTRLKQVSVNRSDPIDSYYGQGESILLVDDVKEQCQIGSDMLSQLGYLVTTVSSGEDAIAYLRNQSVDLVVLDMIMAPGMDGLDTYREIIKLHPTQRAIIASGFSETNRVKEAIALGAGPYIKKPYTWIKLGQAVKTALDAEASTSSPILSSLQVR